MCRHRARRGTRTATCPRTPAWSRRLASPCCRENCPRYETRASTDIRLRYHVIYETRAFCQDRLGTNIGKPQKKMPFFAPQCTPCCCSAPTSLHPARPRPYSARQGREELGGVRGRLVLVAPHRRPSSPLSRWSGAKRHHFQPSPLAPKEHATFVEVLSLCLSRACLGKTMEF